MQVRQTIKRSLLVLSLILGFPITAYASSLSNSSNYQVNEVFFGAGGALNDCSSSYCAKESLGETAVGNTKSTNYQAQAGFNSNRNPYIQFVVNNSNTDVGGLSTGYTSTATSTFSVKSYLSDGYQVVTVSNPPVNNSYYIHNLTSPTTASAGTEQFGMNLVANTSPITFGANPVQVPSSTFSSGAASSGYNTPNYYKYTPGSVIAYSNISSGETDFTISYIYNISNITPGGLYTFKDVLVATSTF